MFHIFLFYEWKLSSSLEEELSEVNNEKVHLYVVVHLKMS